MKDRLKNNRGLKILALIFAIFIWWTVVNIDDPIDIKQYKVEVSIINTEIITNAGKSYQIDDDTKKVTVTVKARRKILSKIKASNIVAVADMREMQDNSVPIRVSIDGYEGEYEEVTAYPRNIQVSVENTLKKTFAITPIATGSPRAGHVVGRLVSSPLSVDISGPESKVSKISKVVAKVDVSELSSDANIETKLIYYDAADNVIDQSQLSSNCDINGVTVKVEIWRTKKVNLVFDTSEIKTAEGYRFTEIEVEPQTLEIAGTTESLSAISTLNFGPEVLQMAEVSENQEVIIDVAEHLPQGIILADSDRTSVVVRILVEQVGTKSVRIPVGSIQILNLSDQFTIEKGPEQEVELQFSGTEDDLKKLGVETIVASIDLVEFVTAGPYVVLVQITEAPEGCSYVGSATIEITLKKK